MSQPPFAHLICPITLQLPLDPVTTKDGQIYERSAILQHFEANGHTSPITRDAIGDKLIALVHVKSLIESSIRDDLIPDVLANNWKEKESERNEFDELVRKAEGGDTDAMYNVGKIYYFGKNGVGKDGKAAFEWYKRASDKRNTRAMGFFGSTLLDGAEEFDVEKNVTSAILLLVMAAEGGSDIACIELGCVLADGIDGLPEDPPKAIYFLTKGLSGKCKWCHASPEFKGKGRVKLMRLKEEASASGTTR
jgi:TPR repeat protein